MGRNGRSEIIWREYDTDLGDFAPSAIEKYPHLMGFEFTMHGERWGLKLDGLTLTVAGGDALEPSTHLWIKLGDTGKYTGINAEDIDALYQLLKLAPTGLSEGQLACATTALDALEECDPDDFITDLHRATDEAGLREACSWATPAMIKAVLEAVKEV